MSNYTNQPDHTEEVLEMVTDTKQASELDDILNAVTNFTYDAMAHRGDPLVGTLPTMDKATAKKELLAIIRNEKLKLLAEAKVLIKAGGYEASYEISMIEKLERIESNE